MPFSPIHHTFAPHVDGAYAWQSLKLMLQPWLWRRGSAQEMLRQSLAHRWNGEVFLFSSGREALLALLRSLKLTSGEEVIVQGYTCIVVPNAVEAAGCVPVFSDIDPDTLNLQMTDAEKTITSRTRAMICQHTFGIPADTEELRALCSSKSLWLIEDCAHVMPDGTGPQEIGKHGDFLFFSFGRDKAVSGITGGAVVSRHSDVSRLLEKEEERAVALGLFTIKRLLLYPLLYFITRPLYGIGIGKASLWLAAKLHFLAPIVTETEKCGHMSPLLHKLPNACAALVLNQLQKLTQINDHRRMLTRFYMEELKKRDIRFLAGITHDLPLQKFPLFVKGADTIRAALKKNGIHLDDGWTGCVICPSSVALDATNYVPGSDPQAQSACEKILALPTHPTMRIEQARMLMKALGYILLHP